MQEGIAKQAIRGIARERYPDSNLTMTIAKFDQPALGIRCGDEIVIAVETDPQPRQVVAYLDAEGIQFDRLLGAGKRMMFENTSIPVTAVRGTVVAWCREEIQDEVYA